MSLYGVFFFLFSPQLPKQKGNGRRLALQDLVVGRELPMRVTEVLVSFFLRKKKVQKQNRERAPPPKRRYCIRGTFSLTFWLLFSFQIFFLVIVR
jgi:hypothetical protein